MFVCMHVLIGLLHPVNVSHCEHVNVGGYKEKTVGVHGHREGGRVRLQSCEQRDSSYI